MTTKTPAFAPHGKHLIAGEWIDGGATFSNAPTMGSSNDFQIGTPEHVDPHFPSRHLISLS